MDEDQAHLTPLVDKPIQKETAETKRAGSVSRSIFLRYIRAGGCGTYGLLSLFMMFAITCAVILLSNWWLGRWSNAERTRYASTVPCPSVQQSKISNMTTDEWFRERDRFFYVLLGKHEVTEKGNECLSVFRPESIERSSTLLPHIRVLHLLPSDSPIIAQSNVRRAPSCARSLLRLQSHR